MPVAVEIIVVHAGDELSYEDAKELYKEMISELGCEFPVDGRMATTLYDVFEELRVAGPGDVLLVSPGNRMVGGDLGLVYDSLSEYYFLRSLERMGKHYFETEHYRESYECYKPAVDYYVRTCGQHFLVTRDTKMKMARTLLHWGQHEAIMVELVDDALYLDHSSNIQEYATMYLRYAYGLSLLRLGRSYQATEFLAQYYFGYMLGTKDNMEIFESTLSLVLETLAQGDVPFCMEMYRQLMRHMYPRFEREECPVVFLEFCATFSFLISRAGYEKEMLEVTYEAAVVSVDYNTKQSSLLMAVVSCALPEKKSLHISALKFIVETQETLQESASPENKYMLHLLLATTRWVYIWCEKTVAIQILKNTYKKFSRVMEKEHPFLTYCREAVLDRIYTDD